MSSRLHALVIDALDPHQVADFWGGLLGQPVEDDDGRPSVHSDNPAGFRLTFEPTDASRSAPNRIHFHLTSDAPGRQQETVERALALGGRHLDVGQLPDEDHIVLADPEDNALCVIESGNNFLAGTGFLGEVTCDGTRDVGLFWRDALGWRLVWDRNEQTAVQSPLGGTKLSWDSWDPPPVKPRNGRNRQRFDLATADPAREAERLVQLGATRLSALPDGVELADPDGNEFGLHSD